MTTFFKGHQRIYKKKTCVRCGLFNTKMNTRAHLNCQNKFRKHSFVTI